MNREHSIQIPIEDTTEYRRPRGGNNRGKWMTLAGGLATIVLGVPVLLGWVGKGFKIAEAPDQIAALVKHQGEQDQQIAEQKASQREIRAGLNRILSAMRLEPIKEPDPGHKEKDIQP